MIEALWIILEPTRRDWSREGEPLHKVVAHCYLCGRKLGCAGWPAGEEANQVHTFLLDEGLRYHWDARKWVPPARLRRDILTNDRSISPDRNFGSDRGGGFGKREYENFGKRPRVEPPGDLHARTYVSHDELRRRGGRYMPGVVGKMEGRGYPSWEVQLPTTVTCVQCDWPNKVEPFEFPAADLWFSAESERLRYPRRYRSDGRVSTRWRLPGKQARIMKLERMPRRPMAPETMAKIREIAERAAGISLERP